MNNDENTIFGTAEEQLEDKQQKQTSNKGWQQVTIGGVTGILMGAAGMYAANAFAGNEEPVGETGEETNGVAHAQQASSHETANGLKVAEVDQSLSFGEAFAAARNEVGPGGVFHWHGGIYNTYTKQEWDSMSAGERAEFAQQVQPEVRPGEGPNRNDVAQHQPEVNSEEKPEKEPEEPTEEKPEEEPEVRFLGVDRVETENGPWNVGHIVRGDQEVALVDMDDDFVFDVAVSDSNRNGEIDADEVCDISEQHLTVTDFALASAVQEASTGNVQPETAAHVQQDHIADDMPDYMNDADMTTI